MNDELLYTISVIPGMRLRELSVRVLCSSSYFQFRNFIKVLFKETVRRVSGVGFNTKGRPDGLG